jgi:hypothetical protein
MTTADYLGCYLNAAQTRTLGCSVATASGHVVVNAQESRPSPTSESYDLQTPAAGELQDLCIVNELM